MNRFRLLGALLALTLIPSVSRAADPRPAGAEFILGACTTCREQAPAVAGAPSGALAAVWEGKTATDPRGLLVRFFSAKGKPQGAERLVSKNLAADQYDPAVAATANGYVVAWSEVDQGKSDVLVQRFKSSGAALGAAIRVSVEAAPPAVPGVDYSPAVAAAANGSFVVAWVRYIPPAGEPAILVRRFDSSGKALSGQVQVSSGLVKGEAPDICVPSNGGAVIVWGSIDARRPFEASLEGVSLRRLSSAGLPVGTAEQVVAAADAETASAAVSCGKGGTFVVAYELDRLESADDSDIFVQRFTSLGVPVAGPALRVNTSIPGRQRAPKISHDAAGNFVVVWTFQQESGFGLTARRLSAAGTPLSGEIVVELSDSSTHRPLWPDVAHAGKTGGFVVTWQEGSGSAFGRRYVP